MGKILCIKPFAEGEYSIPFGNLFPHISVMLLATGLLSRYFGTYLTFTANENAITIIRYSGIVHVGVRP